MKPVCLVIGAGAGIGNGVGGSSIYWAAHAPRFRPQDFRVFSDDGVAEDWPLTYTDLDPYFALNEQRIGLAWKPGDPNGPDRSDKPLQLPPIGSVGALPWSCRFSGTSSSSGCSSAGWSPRGRTGMHR